MGVAYRIAELFGFFLIPGVLWILGIVFAKKTSGLVFWGAGSVFNFMVACGSYAEFRANEYQRPSEFYQELVVGVVLWVLSVLLLVYRRRKAKKAADPTQSETGIE